MTTAGFIEHNEYMVRSSCVIAYYNLEVRFHANLSTRQTSYTIFVVVKKIVVMDSISKCKKQHIVK
jgi:hypothetical protein